MNTKFNPINPLLITGGAGFLGSHMAAYCMEKKIDFVLIDNLCNSDLLNLKKLEIFFQKPITFFQIDLRNKNDLNHLFRQNCFSAVIHFAALKSVKESFDNPSLYFENNVNGSLNLINCIKEMKIRNVVFSSSATVYGDPKYIPIDENHPINPLSPYGETKYLVEKMFTEDGYFKNICVQILRYFNPIGSYNGIIGERPKGIPSNLMPYLVGVAQGKYKKLNIYGSDYETIDGTGVRDYIHVMDLIEAHWIALLESAPGCHIYNVGCGKKTSVKEMIKTFEKVNKVKIPYEYKNRREGDVAISFADVKKIKNSFNWEAKFDLNKMCFDSWEKNFNA